MRRRVALVLLLLALACGPRPAPGPDDPGLTPRQVGQAFASALLDRARVEEAERWALPAASLGIRSQAGFLAPPGRRVSWRLEEPRQEGGVWVVPVRIESLDVAGAHYQGRVTLRLDAEGRRVESSGLELQRSDGAWFRL